MKTTKILIVAATHGHEKIGLRVFAELEKLSLNSQNVELLIGNPVAEEKNVPFIESDLNRIFPGNEQGTLEEKRAFELSKKLKVRI